MSSNPKAEKFEKLGDKAMTKFDWFGAMKESNMEAASEHYVKAAAQYKISKDFEKSGECYEKAAKSSMGAGNEIEAVGYWRESGKMYRHVNPKKAMNSYKYAIQYYLESNRFSQAAKLQEEIAEMLLEDDNIEEAIQAYEECADLFKTENDLNSMNKRLLKVAHMSAKLKKHERSIEIFEQVANHNVDNNLLRWNVKTLLFKAMVCQLNMACVKHSEGEKSNDDMKDFDSCEEAFESYQNISDIFASSREAKLMAKLVMAVPGLDMDAFKEAVIDYDRISKLEPWCTEQLLIVERWIDERNRNVDLFGGLGDNGGEEKEKESQVTDNNETGGEGDGGGPNPFDMDQTGGGDDDNDNGPDLMDAPDLL